MTSSSWKRLVWGLQKEKRPREKALGWEPSGICVLHNQTTGPSAAFTQRTT